ncbi:Host attachment protein [Pseudoxanthomonas broegbernensis]|uniref:Host attachment protein n=1 Tax=Pseudoxanthomonas broegbernensis TaxID=83619 RepID=A0A7V8K783_9GAMM|nr:host attachment family protein [Pseudoxanthomonas broegbernensis]KAF1686734.1 Host attachment protein [Pseudoxanthomonas broegbernensis]MBB6063498.1 protein required for attachment to host cells [Pseudoxanthomonas broegbernensis]
MRRIPREAWVLVADGASARLFRNLGSETGQVRLHQEESLVLDPAEGVMPTVLPADTPLREAEEASFARQLAQRLNQEALGGRFRHLVLAADPQTLGQIRPLLHEEVRARLLAEVPKNYTNARREDIERALAPEF